MMEFLTAFLLPLVIGASAVSVTLLLVVFITTRKLD